MTQPPPTADPVIAWAEKWVLPYLLEDELWPILFALLGSALCLLTVLLVHAWRADTPWMIGAVVFLFLAAVDVARREIAVRRRPGALTAVLAGLWFGAAVAAYFAGRSGLL